MSPPPSASVASNGPSRTAYVVVWLCVCHSGSGSGGGGAGDVLNVPHLTAPAKTMTRPAPRRPHSSPHTLSRITLKCTCTLYRRGPMWRSCCSSDAEMTETQYTTTHSLRAVLSSSMFVPLPLPTPLPARLCLGCASFLCALGIGRHPIHVFRLQTTQAKCRSRFLIPACCAEAYCFGNQATPFVPLSVVLRCSCVSRLFISLCVFGCPISQTGLFVGVLWGLLCVR